MAKSKTKTKTNTKTSRRASVVPLPPVIYINDGVSPGAPEHVLALIKLLPKYSYSAVTETFSQDAALTLLEVTKAEESVAVFISTQPHVSTSIENHSSNIQQTCIKHGRNFLSVNLYQSGSPGPKTIGAQRLAYAVQEGTTPDVVARDVLKWLFKTLAPVETLHLISDDELKAIDTTNFPEYTYCPLAESRLRPKDATIQFVAVIVSKPVLSPTGNKLTWSVADKTGIANFYFQHRGTSSQYTWDWVLSLQPGQRVALPRMPSIQIKESLGKRAAKAPFRIVGFSLMVPAAVVILAGKGLHRVGKKACMGASAKWVARADAVVDAKGRARERGPGEAVQDWEERAQKLSQEEKSEFRVFDEKGMMRWDSVDEDARTEKGSVAGSEAERREKEALLA